MKRTRAIKVFLIAAVFILCISFISIATGDRPTVYKNDTKYAIDDYPAETVDGKVFVPINFFIGFNNIEYEYGNSPVGFYFRNKNTGRYFSFSSTSTFIVVDGEFTDVSFPILNSTIYMPLDYCADILSLKTEHKNDGKVKRIRVTDGTQKLSFDELIELYDPTEKPEEPPVTEPEQPIVIPEIPPVTEPELPTHENRYIYLTFDVQPSGYADKVMERLNESGHKATFLFDIQSMTATPKTVINAFISGHSVGVRGDSEEEIKKANDVLYDILNCYTRIASLENLTDEVCRKLADKGYIVNPIHIDSNEWSSANGKNVARGIYNKTFERTVSVVSIDANEKSPDIIQQLLYYISGDEYATALPFSTVAAVNTEVKHGD